MKRVTEGAVFHGFTVVSREPDKIRPNGKKRPVWLCVCECGEFRKIESQSLVGKNKPCCVCRNNVREHTHSKFHGYTGTPTYNSYHSAKSRCNNPNETGYENYGGRGIRFCDRWSEPEGKGFKNFLEDLGERPANTTLDRIDVNGHYEPGNCRWADNQLQAFNTNIMRTNTSGRTGVYWFKRVNKWVAAIFIDKKQRHLGYFDSFDEAVDARRKAELAVYGRLKHEQFYAKKDKPTNGVSNERL